MRSLLDRIRTKIAGRYWGRAASAGGIPTWMGEIVVRERINRRISGASSVWPTDWLEQNIQGPLATGVSLGCGEGALERDLIQKQICRTILGIDVSEAAIELARKRAAEMKTGSISYRVGDLNRLDLEEQSYEGAFFHQSLHHVSDLDSCLGTVRRSLSAGGLLYLDEYVGPGRREWKRSLIDDAEAIYQTLPDELKSRRRLTYPIDRRDPTEAIRSGDIIRFVEKHFVIESRLRWKPAVADPSSPEARPAHRREQGDDSRSASRHRGPASERRCFELLRGDPGETEKARMTTSRHRCLPTPGPEFPAVGFRSSSDDC